jgi:hypothetical protein
MPPPPDLQNPQALAAYRQELRGVLLNFRRVAVGLAVTGSVYTIARVQ